MNQNREKVAAAYDASRGVFVDGLNQVYGAQEYIDAQLGHIIFTDFDVKKLKGYQAKDFIFYRGDKEYHFYVDDKDVDMINTLTNYQSKKGQLKIRTSKDVKKKLKKGYAIAGIVSTMVVSGIAYAAGSGMINDAYQAASNHIEEVQKENEVRQLESDCAPITNYLMQERTIMAENGTLTNPENDLYNRGDEQLADMAKQIYAELQASFDAETINEMLSGGVLSENGENFVSQYMIKANNVSFNTENEVGRHM